MGRGNTEDTHVFMYLRPTSKNPGLNETGVFILSAWR
ncbi:hypothetical protein CLV44_108160 [Marinobacterium halophilum]|uniref:Uncharacterized protein n=1 Tax=Marinobacterium halophilum TaxID=267374 RepID=A0A2P8EY90_9GAMM|nr:hypothetical protein CLV44_108160 [Marinobacterium halophilum]